MKKLLLCLLSFVIIICIISYDVKEYHYILAYEKNNSVIVYKKSDDELYNEIKSSDEDVLVRLEVEYYDYDCVSL